MSKLFDSGFFFLMILLIVVMFVQYYLTYKQVSSMNKVARRYAEDGYVFAVGRTKGWLRKINLLVVADSNGVIYKSEILDGITVFARYKTFPQFNGMKIDALRNACQQIEDYLINQKGENRR